MELKNYDELIPQIACMMMMHDKANTSYQEDIYLYVDADGNGRVELFQNVGGNSWLDDDHYTLHCLPERYASEDQCFEDDFADYVDAATEILDSFLDGVDEYDDSEF